MVGHAGTLIHKDTVAHIHRIARLTNSVFESNHHGGDLESRARLRFIGHGMVLSLGIDAFADAGHVGYRLNLSGFHLHHHGSPGGRIDTFQHIYQRLLGNILDVDVYSRTDIHPIHRLDFRYIRPSSANALHGANARHTPEQRIVLQLQPVLAL